MVMDTSKPITPEMIAAASPADIASLTTRHVKTLHERWRLDTQLCYDYIHDTDDMAKEPPHVVALFTAVRKLKSELDTRPHVPNKLEAKRLRQEAAKRGR